jgi:lysophospholipase L1-like esterase
LKEVVSVKLASHLLFDARFREDGTAYDASKYEHQISTITGDYMYTYFNKTANRYVARFNCTTPGGGRATSYYKFDYGNNTDFKNRIADNHTIECLCMMDHALDGVYDYEIKPFSSMQSGGTGFVVGKKNNANKLFFLPNTGSWTFADTKIVMEEGVYYHLVGTFDAASKETKVYVNGKLYGTFTNSSTTFKHASATSQWFAIGGDPNGATSCGDGWRGDVVTSKIYDNVLSQEEVDVLWKEANMGLPYSTVKYDVVLFGDSITQYWMSPVRGNPTFFTDNNWYNRGISGNTTADMLARFNYDLEQLAPKVMVFCGGTNDIAQNDGVFVSNEEILENIKTMVTRAEAVGTTVILCSLLPANAYYWSTAIENPSQEIIKVNELIKAYANEKGITYVDYWTPLHDETNGLPQKYTSDGVHPNKECYTIMQNILKPVVTDVLSKIK